MSAEFFLKTKPNENWAYENKELIETIFKDLNTYRGFSTSYDSYVLVDREVLWSEELSKSGKAIPNVYFYFNKNNILMMIVNHASSDIAIDIDKFVRKIRNYTNVTIVDDDNEPSNWSFATD